MKMQNPDWRLKAKPLTVRAAGAQSPATSDKRRALLPEGPPVSDDEPLELGLTTQFRELEQIPVGEVIAGDDFPPTVLASAL
jgi:hypothetical protein